MIYCPSCGHGLRFEIKTQQMICDACGNGYDPATTGVMNKNVEEHRTYDSYVFTCPSCGGELLTTDQNDAVGFCPFCGGASMLYQRMVRQWEPEYIIPFQITKEQCKELYLKEARRSIFTSSKYRDPKLIEGFRGIYMPYWSYQAVQKGTFILDGEKKGAFTKKTYRISGNVDLELDGFGHDASRSFADRISEDLAPFDPNGHKPFAPGYLSGFYADVGDVNAHDYDQLARREITEDTARLMAKDDSFAHADGGMQKIRIDTKKATIPTAITAAHRTLYPVWFMSYRNQDKITYAAVNGQTGKVSADLPVSPWKILITVLIVGVLLAAALFVLPSVKAVGALGVSLGLLLTGTLILRHSFHIAVTKENGLFDTEEAVRFRKGEKWRLLAMIVTLVIGAGVIYLDPAYNIITYLCCIGAAVELFCFMISHIRFQAAIAKREPPQFKKKGAAYDEK